MSNPFGTPTYRPTNPLDEVYDQDQQTARASPSPLLSPPSTSSSALTSPPRPPHPRQPRMRPTLDTVPSYRSSQSRSPAFAQPKSPTSLYSAKVGANVAKNSTAGRIAASKEAKRRSGHGGLQGGMSTPQGEQEREHSPEDLVRFAHLCRRQYYDNDATAASKVGEILQTAPSSSVAIYSRTMANIRSEYHRDKELEHQVLVERTLASIHSGSTIKAALGVSLEDGGGTLAMRSKKARQARHALLKAFLEQHAVKAVPANHPFFQSLFAALWLQSLEQNKGGAGRSQVEWEVDVAVFSSWAKEAIEALKGVLGMSERVKETVLTDKSPRISTTEINTSSISTSAGQNPSRSIESTMSQVPCQKKQPPAVPPHRASLRGRAPSDPFLDATEKLRAQSSPPALPPRQLPPPSIDGIASPDLADATSSTPFLSAAGLPSLLASPVSPVSPPLPPAPTVPLLVDYTVESHIRIFTLPSYLTNPELRSLCRLFPSFISSPARDRLRKNSTSDCTKTQKGSDANGEWVSLPKVGHGELRISSKQREEGWKGSLWERFVAWLLLLFRRG